MRHTCHRSFCATVAISAALSLGSTPLLAQEAAPTLDLPPAAEAPPAQPAASPSAPQQAPTIALPDFEERFRDAATMDARDEAVPATAPAARASRTASADAPRRASRGEAEAAAPSPSIAKSAPAAVDDVNPSASDPLAAPSRPAAAREDVPVAEAEPAAAREPMDVPDEAIAAALLGVVGLGAAGFLATRRRRRDYDQEYEEEAYEPVAEEAPVPATATERDFVDEPITSIPEELALRRPTEAEAVDEQAVADEPVASQSFAMPEGPVPTGEARRRLIEEMAAAPPDEANPFTSYVSRRKRARIILQARERQLRKQATEPFDWRTYRPPTDEEAPRTSPVNPENADR